MSQCEHRRQRVVLDEKGARVQVCEQCGERVSMIARPPKESRPAVAEANSSRTLPDPAVS